MRNDQYAKRTFAAAPRSLLALMLAMCLLVSALPTAWAATSVGSGSGSLSASPTKVYVQLNRSVLFFTGETYGSGHSVTAPVGAVCQLYTDNYYTASDGLQYYSVYYNNTRYNVLRSDVVNNILSDAQLETYITGTLWKQSVYPTLRERDDLVGDVRVHAVQLALSRLGYYTGALDGEYGKKTADAMKAFQRANGLDPDGSAGPLSQPALFALASGSVVPGTTGTTGAIGSTGTVTTVTTPTVSAPNSGTLKTTASVNLRKRATTSSARLAVIPRGVNLNYISTTVKNGVTWFEVRYNSITGWLMGTYVSASGNSTSPTIGSVTITKPGTRVRKTANGKKTGTVLAKGTVVAMLSQPTTAGGYTWYNIRTSSGLVGYVRGDCATLSTSGGSTNTGSSGGIIGGGSTAIMPSSNKTFVRLPGNTLLFTTEAMPSSGGVTVSAGTVLQMVSTSTYTVGGVQYCSLYYNNQKYNAVYANVSGGVMSEADLNAYVKTLWANPLSGSLKRELNLVGDVRVYALQVALSALGYYSGNLDGNYGSGTQSAVRNFQRKSKITVDGDCGNETWAVLAAQLNGVSLGSGTVTTPGGTTGSVTVKDFGTVNRVQKAPWDWDNAGVDLFPKGSYAKVMDVQTGKVFEIYRWSGSRHADCVPASAADTQTMCEIVGFPYNSNHPNSSQLSLIKADGDKGVVEYTWPDFKNKFGGGKNIGSAWDRRPGLLNVNGNVYAVSLYGFPHGFNGTDSFSKSHFPNGQYFYAVNNYYGMMCVHFSGSTTHSGTSPDSKHQAAIDTAYNYAKKLWPTLVK